MKLQYVALLVLVSAALAFYAGSKNVKTETKVVEKEVVRNNVVTVTKEVVKPDGTKEVTTVTTDKTVKRDESKKAETTKAPDWFLQIGASSERGVYEANVNRRILGNLYLGAGISTNGYGKLYLGMEF